MWTKTLTVEVFITMLLEMKKEKEITKMPYWA